MIGFSGREGADRGGGKPNYKAALDLRKLGEERGSLLQRLGGMVCSLLTTNEIGHGRPSLRLSSLVSRSRTHTHTDRELEKSWAMGHGKLFDPPGCGSQA